MQVLAPGIWLIDSVFPESAELIKKFENSIKQGYVEWQGSQVLIDGKDVEDMSVRNCLTFGIKSRFDPNFPVIEPTPAEEIEWEMSTSFRNNFQPYLEDYFKQNIVEIHSYDSYVLLKYGVGNKFNNHVDDNWKYPRRVSLIYYVNDDYEGGEIGFGSFNLKIKPKANQLLIFPSSYSYNHEVYPVTKGERYAVVQWMY